MILTQPALLCTLLICTVASVALPLDIGLDLEGMSNKLCSSSIAVANPYRPSDVRRERTMKQNGKIVYFESVQGPGPEHEDPDEELDSEPIPPEKTSAIKASGSSGRPKRPKGMAKLTKNRKTND
ncbi:unnamed protein product [Tuber aestivum]|uniref:Uncharacterized protein n=1 Tax=Tuber aestivum TaxID=59557 RepID=A0A292Q6I7_9PEZI|nr:unnamed protein product [Tuber aestivum]